MLKVQNDSSLMIMNFILISIFLFFNPLIFANQKGNGFEGYPLVKNIYSSEYKFQPQNWSIVQDSKGIIYFANFDGIIEYDGLSWDITNNTYDKLVRSLTINQSGTIYVGGSNEIGYLISDSAQSLQYFSLLNKIGPLKKDFSSVYQTHQNHNGVYFRTNNYLFHSYKDSIIVFKSSTKFNRSFSIDNTIYIGEQGIGLSKIHNDSLELIKGGDFFSDNYAMVFLKMNNEKFLIGTRYNNFFIYDGFNIVPFQTEADNYVKENQLYQGVRLSDGNNALATLHGGVIIINDEGKLVEYYNESTGLQDNDVKYIFQDSQDNIWLALNNGIAKIEYSSPFSIFDKRMGLDGIVLSITKFRNNLYVGTTSGLYKLNSASINDLNFRLSNFKKNDLINTNVWSLLNVNNELLVGSNDGIYLIGLADKAKKISSSVVYTMHNYDKTGNLVFIGTRDGLGALYKDGNEWLEHSIYPITNTRITTISESLAGDIWIGTSSGEVLKISKSDEILENILNGNKTLLDESSVTKYDSTYGLPPGEINIFSIAGRSVFATGKGIYKFNDKLQKFIPDSTFDTMFADGSRGVFRIIEDKEGNVWIHSNSENFFAEYQKDGSYKIISKPFRRLEPSQVNAIYPDGDVVWFGRTNSEIIKYDTRKKKKFVTNFSALIRKVLINGDSLIYGGAPLPADFETLSLSYDNRNLRFQYACPFYEGEERTEYQYKLDGYDKDWSVWKKETQKDYTNLQEGSYTFNIRAKNIYGDVSKIAAYSFKVLPPFYRTIWAYLLYSIMLLTFGFLIVKWRINKLEKEKNRLSQIVDEKTGEVTKQNIRLEEQAEKLKELDKIKSRFFANISHEFRTPLTLILGPTEEMIKEEKSPEKKIKHSLILRNSKKLLNLINQLLDISKLESGKMQLHIRKINIVNFIREITFMFESLADRKKINLGFYFEQEELDLYCDTDKIEKVIVNLLANAFKFTGENGEVTVVISKEEQSETFPLGYIKIMVLDTGIGISQENLEHIFDPFYQTDSSAKREFGGTGIGLSLVKEFVELHKGSVTVESMEGKGSKFIIKFPQGDKHFDPDEIISESLLEEYKEESLDQIDLMVESEEVTPEKNDSGEFDESEKSNEKDTILVVDDNRDVRTYIKQHLEKYYAVIEASDGAEGLAKAKEIYPDLIASDVMMPKMDGFELCENIKRDINTSHIPVILLTAKAGDENVLQGLETGADDYITKPFNVEMLLQRIKNLIELRKQLQQKYQKQLFLQPAEIKVTSVDETFLKKLHELVEENLSNPDFNIENLLDKFNMSHTSLFRKIKALTGEPPVKFLRSYRLKRAAQLLKAKSGNITEIAFSVGFNNSAYFTKCFKEQFKRLPSEYQSIES